MESVSVASNQTSLIDRIALLYLQNYWFLLLVYNLSYIYVLSPNHKRCTWKEPLTLGVICYTAFAQAAGSGTGSQDRVPCA